MIDLPRPPFHLVDPRIKVYGLGGAGCNVLDRLVLDGLPGADLVAINTDSQALAASVAPHKVQIGQTITRGLGAGGDPEVGRTAAEEGIGEILGSLEEAGVVFILAGLGGGTGSGAAPTVAEISREHNALVIVLGTLPFGFEGPRRAEQALASLGRLRDIADLVICFENDRMADGVSPDAPIVEAFAEADRTIAAAVRALSGVARRRGIVHAGFDQLAAAVRGVNPRCLFGHGEAAGGNRAHEALGQALRNPLLQRGRRLGEAGTVWVQVAGGDGLTLNEVQIAIEAFQRHVPANARVFWSAATDPALEDRFAVTVLSAIESAVPVAPRVAAPSPAPAMDEEELYALADAHVELPPPPPAVEEPAVEPVLTTLRTTVLPARSASPPRPREARAEAGQFDNTRGRFEKSEPTIIDGEDLDVPTFLRRSKTRP